MKIIITLICIAFFKYSFCQITTTKVIDKEISKKAIIFDSTLNFLGANVLLYKGQELYLTGKPETLRIYGYSGFIIDYKASSSSLKNTYKPIIPEDKKYIQFDMGGKSVYDSLAGKYFKVLDVYHHPKAKEQENLYGTKYFLALEEKESGNKLFFEYDCKYEHSFPFIVAGYFEKQKKQLVGTKYVVRGNNWIGDEQMTDIGTGKPANFTPGSTWECIDLTIEEKYYTLSLIIKNSLGEKIPLGIDNIVGNYWVFNDIDAMKYKQKFGNTNWVKILKREVIIGFTEEMVKLSWGEPIDINHTSYGDQWIYKDQYLYFENGKLKSFN